MLGYLRCDLLSIICVASARNNMQTNYNSIAIDYTHSKTLPWRNHLECFTFFELTGPLNELSVLDLACGEGFYSRMLKKKGAAHVTAVDLSEQMIQLAKAAELQSPLGIEYLIGDAKEIQLNRQYDIITASYLLNYARDESELLTMCAAVGKHLKPGGRFITVNNNPSFIPTNISFRKYGFERNQDDFREGGIITYQLLLPDGRNTDIINYHLSAASHNRCLEACGFEDIQHHPMQVSPEGKSAFPSDFWDDLLHAMPVTIISCTKAMI
jgi:ubiquinone/menaquinone biosynthesis C-methylase UbiE